MKRLTPTNFATAQRFIEKYARPLEQARFRHAFQDGSQTEILEALRAFQNPDGGFGRALEPDLRAPESSALATSHAFQVLRSLSTSASHELIASALTYLLVSLDREEAHWRIIPPAAQRSPHAPWWDQAGREDEFDTFSLNPTAELLGYCYEQRASVPEDVLTLLANRIYVRLAVPGELEMHELLCCLRMEQTIGLPGELVEVLGTALTAQIPKRIATNPSEWTGYSLRPVQVVESPDSPWLGGLEDAVAANLDYEIDSQSPDGSWAPTWDWGGSYPEHWELARREWAGVLTLEKLLLLKRWQRISYS